jgi:bifunctional DNA-binding transcriptional regulator/antitoxin component of YhaV-PrlF toxin-antitoxin module
LHEIALGLNAAFVSEPRHSHATTAPATKAAAAIRISVMRRIHSFASFRRDCHVGLSIRDSRHHSLFCSIAVILHFMKTVLTITSRGVVTLPAKLRQVLGLKADDQLIAETTPQGLLLRPSVTLPVEIYTSEREREFDEAEADLAALQTNKGRLAKKTTKPRR